MESSASHSSFLHGRFSATRELHSAATMTCSAYQKLLLHAGEVSSRLEARVRREGRIFNYELQDEISENQDEIAKLKEALEAAKTREVEARQQMREAQAAWEDACERARAEQREREWRRGGQEGYRGPQEGNRRPLPSEFKTPWSERSPPPQPKKAKSSPQSSKKDSKRGQAAIDHYFDQVSRAFADISALNAFPKPPAWPCGNLTCARTKRSRALEACACNIRFLFERGTDLKNWRLRFHPDRFSKVPQDVREGIQQMAKEVFVVVDDMYRKAAAKGET